MVYKINKNDFWEWAYSDLLVNNQRGHLAEYIVAKALGIERNKRLEWDPYDLAYKNVKIEVKSSAYVQSWEQKRLSIISFDIAPTRLFDYETNSYEEKRKRQSDFYVFCLLEHKERETIDPLSLDQWSFFVVATPILDENLGMQKRISLSTLSKLGAQKLKFENIKEFIDANI